ncbi:GNAT family N-acetyltransferase [Paracoccus caeni]|uniref:GNAT family N-acetyltransferase n=1 Tax=Paracoccus caeni TaxID=657651 RepID=A0A934SIB8_9RHOB|nr:GNAT family N-acetyltransferase [Paracoccus caeni]MBK4215689.1 GNAT family N-acetyltransferase [Paracoccus caeni]
MSDITFRPARRDEVAEIVAMLADDFLGRDREQGDLVDYEAAFDEIAASAANELIVGEREGSIAACYQMTYIPGLSLSAARRALIEGVRVHADHRGHGIGAQMMADAEDRARRAGCTVLQFTTNKSRTDAHRFYDRLGFTPSHIGYKKTL